jgi:hypothetical protein
MATSSSLAKSLKLTSTLPAVTVGSISAGLQIAGLNPFEGSFTDLQKMLAESLAPENESQNTQPVSGSNSVKAPKQNSDEFIDPSNYLSHFEPLSNSSRSLSQSQVQNEENNAVKDKSIDNRSFDNFSEEPSANLDKADQQSSNASVRGDAKASASSAASGQSIESSISESETDETTAGSGDSIDSGDSTDIIDTPEDTDTLVDAGQIFISNGTDLFLEGTAYDDTLIGSASGTDILMGGAGDDIYLVSSINQDLIEDSDGGTDKVITSVSGLDSFGGIEITQADDQSAAYASSFNIQPFTQGSSASFVLSGGFDSQSIIGGEGSDYLSSSTATTLMGSGGDDVYVYTGSEILIEDQASGMDTVLTYSSISLADHIEYAIIKSDAGLNITGNDSDNILIGNSSDNVLTGGAGNDILVSLGGEDDLLGGAGIDIFILSSNEISYISDYEEGEQIIFALNEPPTTLLRVEAFSGSGASDTAEWMYSDGTLQIDWDGDSSTDSMLFINDDKSITDADILVSNSYTSVI